VVSLCSLQIRGGQAGISFRRLGERRVSLSELQVCTYVVAVLGEVFGAYEYAFVVASRFRLFSGWFCWLAGSSSWLW
jgi:hypothetical protein